MDKGAITFIVIIIGVILIMILALVLSAMESVSINHIGLRFHRIQKKVIGDVYQSGRHFPGIGHRFIQYPTTNIIISFDNSGEADSPEISAWTRNGQTIFIEISFFVRLINYENAEQFYFSFGEHWKSYFLRLAETIIKDITTNFEELDFYLQRELVNHEIH